MSNNVDEALKEIELQKMLLENLGIVAFKKTNDERMSYLIERVMNTCFMPFDSETIYLFKYEGWDIGGVRLYVHDTGDCVIVLDLRQSKLPLEVIKQLLLLGYKSESPEDWIGYKKRVY